MNGSSVTTLSTKKSTKAKWGEVAAAIFVCCLLLKFQLDKPRVDELFGVHCGDCVPNDAKDCGDGIWEINPYNPFFLFDIYCVTADANTRKIWRIGGVRQFSRRKDAEVAYSACLEALKETYGYNLCEVVVTSESNDGDKLVRHHQLGGRGGNLYTNYFPSALPEFLLNLELYHKENSEEASIRVILCRTR